MRVLYLRYSETIYIHSCSALFSVCRSRSFITFLSALLLLLLLLFHFIIFCSLGRCYCCCCSYCCYCYSAKPQTRQNVKRKKTPNEIYLHTTHTCSAFSLLSWVCQVSFHMCNCICICVYSSVSVVTSSLPLFSCWHFALEVAALRCQQLLTIYANIMSIYNILFAHTRM